MTGLLQNKTAIVYGAAGPVGAAVAGAFAREGARVVLTGRTAGTLAKVAEQIQDAGGLEGDVVAAETHLGVGHGVINALILAPSPLYGVRTHPKGRKTLPTPCHARPALAIPLAVITAMPSVGAALVRWGIGRLPEETAAPVVLDALALPAIAAARPAPTAA